MDAVRTPTQLDDPHTCPDDSERLNPGIWRDNPLSESPRGLKPAARPWCGSILDRLAARLLYRAARWVRRRSTAAQLEHLQKTTNESEYRGWRRRELEEQLTSHFDVRQITGRDVLDFGCGTGELSHLVARYDPHSVVGVDVSTEAIARATRSSAPGNAAPTEHSSKRNTEPRASARAESPTQRHCTTLELPHTSGTSAAHQMPRFIHNESDKVIPLADDSVDLICCFDVVEHISDFESIANEWRRILRPGGKVWIWWSPWRSPYGHHLESLIPIPWVHLLLPERTIFKACADLYDDPDYVPRKWDVDFETGAKKANKWRTTDSFYPFLNRLTRRRFERTLQVAGLRIARREVHGFRGSWARRATHVLLPFPAAGECFASYYIYELLVGPV